MNDYKFGNFLCSLRESKELTQAEVAQILSVTPAAVSKWENGESKPRLETLFKLAEILEVTVEELIAGEFIEKDNAKPDDESIKRYEYLTRIDTLLTSRVRLLRVCAFVTDWNIMGLPMILWMLIFFISYPMKGVSPSESEMFRIFAGMLIMLLAWFVCFVLRDVIFKGRSLGKRIFGLTIIDRKSGNAPAKKQLILRNIFLFIYNIDAIVLMVRGISIGDSVAQTLVVSKKQLEESKADSSAEVSDINRYVNADKERKKVLSFSIFGFVLFLVFAAFMSSFIFGIEKTETYQVAYNYLVESESFKKLDVDEDRIKWRSMSITKSDTNEITFSVEGKEYEVISHNENGSWKVCEDCTKFK